MGCIKCGEPTYQLESLDYISSYCEVCNKISVERWQQRQKWAAYHDEPCPEVELSQFPRRRKDAR